MTDDKKKFQKEWDKILAPTTPTRPVNPAPVSGVYSQPDLENVLRQAGWPEEHVPYMAQMGIKESSGVVGADRIRQAGQGQRLPEKSYGLWQINTLAHPQYDPQKLATDPVYNAKAALEVFQKQGFDAWFNSRRKLEKEGIFPGQAPAATPTVDVNSLFPNVGGFQQAPTQEVDVNSLFPNAEGFQKAIPQTPTDVGIPTYKRPDSKPLESSIPSKRPVLQPKAPSTLAAPKVQPTQAVGSEPEVGRAEEDYGVAVDQGVYVQDHSKVGNRGDRSGNVLKTVTVDYTPERSDRQYTARRAAETVARDLGLSADQVTKLTNRLAQAPKLSEGNFADQYYISKEDIAAVKGQAEFQTDQDMRNTELNRGFQEVSLDSLFSPEEARAFNEADRSILETPIIGADDYQNVAAGALRSGGGVWRSLAGLYRAANDLWSQPFGDGTNRFINPQREEDIKAYRGDDIYQYMTSIAEDAEGRAGRLAARGGTRAEIFQMIGGLPGDLSRVMLLSRLPGGIVTGMSADMAAQSSGRGESATKVGKEAFKGALFGAIARFATPVGKGIAENTGSRLVGGAGSIAFTGAATYPVSRAFGASEKDALKETIFNTIFALGDAAPVLAGRTVRARNKDGAEVAVKIDETGNVQEVQLPKDQPADVEVYDPYWEQQFEASDRMAKERSRPILDRMDEAEFTIDGPEAIAANRQATSVLTDLAGANFHGFPSLGEYSGYFIRKAEALLDKAQAEKRGGDMVTISNFIAKLKEAAKHADGKAALYTKHEGLEAVTEGTKAEEITHMRNSAAGIKEVADELAQLPGMQRLLTSLDEFYDTKEQDYRVDEAVAQSFRPNPEAHLSLSKAEIRRAQQELYRALDATEGFDVNSYAESLRGISRRGDVFARYARQKQSSRLRGQHGVEDVGGRADQVDPNVRGVQDVSGQRTGDSSGYPGRDTGGQPQRGQLQGRAAKAGEFDIPLAAEVGDAELRRRAEKAIQELEDLKANDLPTKEKIAAILGVEDHSYGRSVSAAVYDLREALDEGAKFPIGDKRSWADQPVIEQAPEPQTTVKAGSEARNQEIFDKVTAPKKGKYVPNPEAVERGSVLADGKIWVQGKQVLPTDENVAVVRAIAEHNKTLIDERIRKLESLRASGETVTRQKIDEIVGADHRYGTDVDAAIRDLESTTLDNGMYLQDITEANAAYKSSAPAPKAKPTLTPKVPKTGESKSTGKIVGDTPVPKHDVNPFKARTQESGFQEYVPEGRRGPQESPSYNSWRARQEQADLNQVDQGQRAVEERVDQEVRQAYKDNGGDQLKSIEDTLARYETVLDSIKDSDRPDAANIENLYRRKIATIKAKYGRILNFARRKGDDTFDAQLAIAFKDNKIFDKKAQDEVMAFTDENFPQLASLWGRKSTGTPLVTNPNVAAAERMQAARGMEAESFIGMAKDLTVGLYKEFKRQFKEIDPNESIQHARAADSFRLLTNLNSWAKVQAMNDVARITQGLTREQYDVFENVLVFRNLVQKAEQQTTEGLPVTEHFGMTTLKEFEDGLKAYETAAKADPLILKALADRESNRRATVQKLVDIDMMGEKALENDRYFHRQGDPDHDRLMVSLGSRDLRVRQKGFQKKLTGKLTDFNTNYIESEVEWLSQANAQIRKTELLNEIKRALDVADDLKVEAKLLGVDWKTLIPKDHRIWQPKEGSYFYRTLSAPDKLIEDIFMGQHTKTSAEAALKEVLVRGQRKPEWVLPEGVAKLMDDFEVQPVEKMYQEAAANIMATWKQWALINPKNYLSYNIRNFISDLDAAMAYPGIITELPQAIKDIYKYSRDKNHAAAAEIEQAIKDGVMDSGMTFAEIPDISKLGAFKMFADTESNILSRGMNKVWDAMKNSTNARENWIRLAAYRHIKKKIEAGETIYGASTRGQVDALASTPGRQAAKIARELVGDYGGISEAGRAVRKYMMPFYSWMEINAPRYVRMIRNISEESGGGARAGRLIAGKVAVQGTKRFAQLAAITAGINAWNHIMFPDLEDQLAKTDVGKRPHLIVGTNPDGSARMFQADTALRDAMDWLDLGDVVSDIYQVADGRATVWDKVGEAVKAPVNRGVQALGPIKTGGELLFGESSFPNIFNKGWETGINTRPIRDRVEHLAQAVAMKGVYQRVMGRPTPPSSGPVGQLSDWFLTQRIDPEESIFWNIRGRAYDYKKKIGKGGGSQESADKNNILFYYKQAIRWNNPVAAERFLKQYKEEFGGTADGLKQSLESTHPLGNLAKADWPDFIKQLTPDERDQLKIAIGYYDETFKKKPEATPAEGTTVDELLKMIFPDVDLDNIDRMVEKERRKDSREELREQRKAARGLR